MRGKKKTRFASWKTYFSSYYFFINLFPLHFKKMISKALGNIPLTLNQSK
jgi:hypothetical protein